MHLHTRNVNTAFRDLVQLFARREEYASSKICPIVERPSRNGPVLMIDEPVTITYSHPRERVLFNAARDANPFFHLYEALWMLAGREDVASVAYYAKQMRQYSDDGEILNGAYGFRWRWASEIRNLQDVPMAYQHFTTRHRVDQLDVIVAHLKADPNSRRAVLQMWNVGDDLLKIGKVPADYARGQGFDVRPADWLPASKDVCCNLSVMFSLREGTGPEEAPSSGAGLVTRRLSVNYLDMTVTNRSNDLIWGALGANYVHFTFLQEYMAARLGAEVGKYHHFTNNLHVYTQTNSGFKPDEWLAEPTWTQDGYGNGKSIVPLVKDPEAFERELPEFVARNDGTGGKRVNGYWTEPFLNDVAQPALNAFHMYRQGDESRHTAAAVEASQIKADDWRIACTEWIKRRVK